MRITPLDIRKQPFKQTFRGYDPYAVRAFLEEIAKQDEQLIFQNNEFATKIKSLEQQLEKYMSIERVLNETLMTAQKMSDDARVNSQKEAELIIKDAQIRADRSMGEAQHKVNVLENEILSIRNQRDSFLSRFKSILTTQLNLLEVISGDLHSDDGSPLQSPPSPQEHEPRMSPVRAPIIRGGSFADDDTLDLDDVPPQPMILA